MYFKCERHVNSKFSLCQLPVRANSKNKTDITQKVIYRRTVLLFTLAPLLLYIIKHSSNISIIKRQIQEPFHISDEMPCDERYCLPTVHCCLKEFHLRYGGFLY